MEPVLVAQVDGCARYLSSQEAAKQLGHAVRYEHLPWLRFYLRNAPPPRRLNVFIRLPQRRIYAEVTHPEQEEARPRIDQSASVAAYHPSGPDARPQCHASEAGLFLELAQRCLVMSLTSLETAAWHVPGHAGRVPLL